MLLILYPRSGCWSASGRGARGSRLLRMCRDRRRCCERPQIWSIVTAIPAASLLREGPRSLRGALTHPLRPVSRASLQHVSTGDGGLISCDRVKEDCHRAVVVHPLEG